MNERPNPLRWLAYVYGAGLPARHRGWVLHDVTTRTWQLRHLVRTTVQLLPVGVLLFLLIPGPVYVRALSVLAGAILGGIMTMRIGWVQWRGSGATAADTPTVPARP